MAQLLTLFCAALVAACAAPSSEPAATLNGRVRDFAEILDPATEARLTRRLNEAERDYGPQIGIVTVSSLEGRSIEDFATDYANDWGLGAKDRDDGLIILVAPNERKARIGTGVGIERNYPDAWAQTVIDEALLPNFRQERFGHGLEKGLDMIMVRMRQFPTRSTNDNETIPADQAA